MTHKASLQRYEPLEVLIDIADRMELAMQAAQQSLQ